MNKNSGPLAGKKILFGLSGSIAAYKAVDWARTLTKEGAQVTVVMTKAATQFVAPLTLAALSGNKVYTDMFNPADAEHIPHIRLARDCDLALIAPATAQTISRLAHGHASELLSCIVLATKAKVLVCPAMNSNMFLHPATQKNLVLLQEYGYEIIKPETGQMACGEEGPGRLPSWETVRQKIIASFAPQDMKSQTVLITAGPTQEPMDPVRFISNPSTGKMGFALAETAKSRGAEVHLISGPTTTSPPGGIDCTKVRTALEMHKAVMDKYPEASIVVMAAAVSDYRPSIVSEHKIKKTGKTESLSMLPNPDILKELGQKKSAEGRGPYLVGFAAESQDHLNEGRRKLAEKNADLLVVNDILQTDAGFAAETNEVTMLDRSGLEQRLPLLTKAETANHIWDTVLSIMQKQ